MIFLQFPIFTGVTQTFTQEPIATTTLPASTGLPPLDKTVTVDTTEPYSATVSFNRAFHNDLRYVGVYDVLVLSINKLCLLSIVSHPVSIPDINRLIA